MGSRNMTLTAPGETLVTETCYSCGVLFAMPLDMQRNRLADKTNFFCPNGHSQVYVGKTDAELLKEANRRLASAQEDERAAWVIAEERRKEAEAERKRHGVTKGQLTKTRKRAAAALCPAPDCHRQIVQMKRHLATKHPDFKAETS